MKWIKNKGCMTKQLRKVSVFNNILPKWKDHQVNHFSIYWKPPDQFLLLCISFFSLSTNTQTKTGQWLSPCLRITYGRFLSLLVGVKRIEKSTISNLLLVCSLYSSQIMPVILYFSLQRFLYFQKTNKQKISSYALTAPQPLDVLQQNIAKHCKELSYFTWSALHKSVYFPQEQ